MGMRRRNPLFLIEPQFFVRRGPLPSQTFGWTRWLQLSYVDGNPGSKCPFSRTTKGKIPKPRKTLLCKSKSGPALRTRSVDSHVLIKYDPARQFRWPEAGLLGRDAVVDVGRHRGGLLGGHLVLVLETQVVFYSRWSVRHPAIQGKVVTYA